MQEEMVLDVRESGEPGILKTSFNFRVLEGIMIIGAEKGSLVQ